MNGSAFGADAAAAYLHEKEVYTFLKDHVPDRAAQQKTPHHVEGGEGGEGEHRGGGGGGGNGSLSSEVDDELLEDMHANIYAEEERCMRTFMRENTIMDGQIKATLKRVAEYLRINIWPRKQFWVKPAENEYFRIKSLTR